MDWFQTSPSVNISVFAKVAVPDQCWVKVNQGRCNIHIVFDGGKSLYEQCLVLRNVSDFNPSILLFFFQFNIKVSFKTPENNLGFSVDRIHRTFYSINDYLVFITFV